MEKMAFFVKIFIWLQKGSNAQKRAYLY